MLCAVGHFDAVYPKFGSIALIARSAVEKRVYVHPSAFGIDARHCVFVDIAVAYRALEYLLIKRKSVGAVFTVVPQPQSIRHGNDRSALRVVGVGRVVVYPRAECAVTLDRHQGLAVGDRLLKRHLRIDVRIKSVAQSYAVTVDAFFERGGGTVDPRIRDSFRFFPESHIERPIGDKSRPEIYILSRFHLNLEMVACCLVLPVGGDGRDPVCPLRIELGFGCRPGHRIETRSSWPRYDFPAHAERSGRGIRIGGRGRKNRRHQNARRGRPGNRHGRAGIVRLRRYARDRHVIADGELEQGRRSRQAENIFAGCRQHDLRGRAVGHLQRCALPALRIRHEPPAKSCCRSLAVAHRAVTGHAAVQIPGRTAGDGKIPACIDCGHASCEFRHGLIAQETVVDGEIRHSAAKGARIGRRSRSEIELCVGGDDIAQCRGALRISRLDAGPVHINAGCHCIFGLLLVV